MVGIEDIRFYTSKSGIDGYVYASYIFVINGEEYSITVSELAENMSVEDLKALKERLEHEIKKKEVI